MLQGLAVVAEEKQAKRVSSGSQNETSTRIQNPISNPNAIERDLWELTQAKVKGIAQRRPVSVADEVKRRISTTTPESILAAMQSLARAMAQAGLSNTNAAAYIQRNSVLARRLGRG